MTAAKKPAKNLQTFSKFVSATSGTNVFIGGCMSAMQTKGETHERK
jgi:hypothetical protein